MGIAMKICAQCHGKLGLGVRFRKVWNGRWWVHVRYCSSHCEAVHKFERHNARANRGGHAFIPRTQSPVTFIALLVTMFLMPQPASPATTLAAAAWSSGSP